MHMADALVSPAVGVAMTAVSAGLLAHSARQLTIQNDDRLVPLMGVTGAFVFAAQMLNFTIPLTGSSGHIGGGLLLAALLGPHAAFIALASVLAVQALLFADGGLLAYGCNLFNLGFWPCCVLYPLVFRPLTATATAGARWWLATVLSVVLGLQLGAFSVVLETKLSGITALPFGHFALLMQSIHLVIGLVEGLATVVVLGVVLKARPELLAAAGQVAGSLRPVIIALAVVALLSGGVLAWFASPNPDGLEWALARASAVPVAAEAPPAWPAVDPGTTVAGVLGTVVTLAVAALAGWLFRRRRPAAAPGA